MWSYSRTLGSRVTGVVFFFVVGLLAASWFVASRGVRQVADDLFREVSRRQVIATQAHLGTAPPALDTLDAALGDTLARATPEDLARAFLGVLRANPGFTWVSYGDEQGSFVGAYRIAGGFRVNRSRIRDGKTELFEHDVLPDGSWREFRHELDTGYDPRTRPFYTAARDRGRRVWNRPYVFFEQGVPGITCSQPHYGADEKLAGVLTIDFDLNALSGFVRSADLSENGTVLLFTPDGTLLAHPDVNVVTRSGAGDQGTLLSVADLPGAPMRALYAELGRKHEPVVDLDGGLKLQTFEVSVDGAPHLASFTAFPVGEDVTWFVGAIAPAKDFLGPVQDEMFYLFLVLIALVGIAVPLASYWLSERFARQLRALSGSMDEVGRLELADTPFLPTRVRELVAMQQALAGMKGGLRSFARYVPRDLVKRLLLSGQEAKLGGETREMTVFFSDIEGFTTIAESMTPAELVLMLSTYLEEMTRIIAAHGGTVDKFLGDGILAFWGAPEADADHALHAAQAALECAAKLDEQVAAGAFGGRKLRARIGLASGPVLVGNIGTTERMNYTVMGDTANLASRLEALNKAYQTRLLVSEETASRLHGAVLARPLDVVAVKGKQRGVKVFELLAKRTGKPAIDADRLWLCEISATALDDYLARDFAKAAAAWERILAAHPGDGPASTMKVRAEMFVRAAPPADWTGVYVAKEK